MFDFRNYPKDSQFFDETNKKFIGKMKDVPGRKINSDFAELKSKCILLKILMVKKLIRLKAYIFQLNLKNLKTLCLTKNN